MVSTTVAAISYEYRGTDKLIFGIVLAVITFGRPLVAASMIWSKVDSALITPIE